MDARFGETYQLQPGNRECESNTPNNRGLRPRRNEYIRSAESKHDRCTAELCKGQRGVPSRASLYEIESRACADSADPQYGGKCSQARRTARVDPERSCICRS